MIHETTTKFLKDLKKNNNRTWFEEHRKQYEYAKDDFLMLVEQLITTIATFDKQIGNLEAKNCLFRINRDLRFSKNKDPYKSNLAAYFNKDGKNGLGAGYYLHIEPGKNFVAGGIWMPVPAVLAGLRQEIDYNFKEWKKIIVNKSFHKYFNAGVEGETLTRPPKGYDENNPAIEFIKKKTFVVSRSFTDAEVQSKFFVKDVAATYKAMKPMIDFINLSTS